jgi:hypothetical protein
VVVGLAEYRSRVAQFYRENRQPQESRENIFLRLTPDFCRRDVKDSDSDRSRAMVAQELTYMVSPQHIEDIVEVCEQINIPALCFAHSVSGSQMHLGEYVARERGITLLHESSSVVHTHSASHNPDMDKLLYRELFGVALWNLVFNEEELRQHSIFGKTVSIGKYAARGVAAAYRSDFERDYLRFDWEMIAENLKDIVRNYEKG